MCLLFVFIVYTVSVSVSDGNTLEMVIFREKDKMVFGKFRVVKESTCLRMVENMSPTKLSSDVQFRDISRTSTKTTAIVNLKKTAKDPT